MPDCGININLAPITADFYVGMTLPACLTDVEKAVKDIKQTYTDAMNKDYPSLLTDAMTLFGDAQKVATDCKLMSSFRLEAALNTIVANGTDPTSCMMRITDVFSVIQKYFTENSTLEQDPNHVVEHMF